MAVTFPAPRSPARSILQIDDFKGADFTNAPVSVDESQSPNCQNMIRSVAGKVRKCMGYEPYTKYSGKINGIHYMKSTTDIILVHAGTDIYWGNVKLYSDANDEISNSWQMDKKLFIQDGKKLLVFYSDAEREERQEHEEVKDIKKWLGSMDEYTEEYNWKLVPVEEIAYVPTLTIGKNPFGGGTDLEPLNLMTPAFTEEFLPSDEAGDEEGVLPKDYHLSFGELDSDPVNVWIMNSNGDWVEKQETTDFTVDRTTGIVTFKTAPPRSPRAGEDSVRITARRTVERYINQINHTTIGILYGVSGAQDRLFVSGNDDFPNRDWYSQINDLTYFGDTSYSTLGSDRSKIVGYSIIFNYLAAHKDERERDQSIVMREGVLNENKPSFPIVNTLQGPGAIAKHSFTYLGSEPLFLTRSGIYAVTAQDITGERYAQNRSFYLNGKLLKEPNLENAYACVHNDLYWLCVNGVAYILDGLQALHTDKSLPYATRQYAGFYRTNIPASVMFTMNSRLFFGTAEGDIFRFYNDEKAQESYNDNGMPIEAIWETPDIDGKIFYKNKTFRYFAARLESAVSTSIKIYAMKRGIWSLVKFDELTGRYLKFSELIFSKITFSTDTTQKIVNSKLRIKKVDKARFRLVNDQLNEPFGLYDIAFEYVENGNYKG